MIIHSIDLNVTLMKNMIIHTLTNGATVFANEDLLHTLEKNISLEQMIHHWPGIYKNFTFTFSKNYILEIVISQILCTMIS